MAQQENLITRINYNKQLIGLFGLGIFGISGMLLRNFERGPHQVLLPNFLQNNLKLYDSMATPSLASLTKFLTGDLYSTKGKALIGATPNIIYEVLQKFGMVEGYYSFSDIIVFALGSLGFMAFEGTAKFIHDSGISLPVYRILHIQHRKFG